MADGDAELGRMVSEVTINYTVRELLGRIEERQVRTDERVQQLASRADVEALSVIVQRHEHRWQRMIGAACALGAVSGGVAGWIVQALSGGTP